MDGANPVGLGKKITVLRLSPLDRSHPKVGGGGVEGLYNLKLLIKTKNDWFYNKNLWTFVWKINRNQMEKSDSRQGVRKVVFFALAVLCLTPWVSSPVALALGFFVSIAIQTPFSSGKISPIIHQLLKVCIIGLGFGLELNEALKAGKEGFFFTVGSISFVLVVGFVLGRLMKQEGVLSYLISVGTAICGGSAIAAISPIIKASGRQISVALAVVFLLNSIALFIYPAVGHWLGLSQGQFGLWCAIGIHDTSSVVGAASKFGDEALRVATTVKLARALWIIPLSLLTLFFVKNSQAKVKIPWFIGGFVLAILVGTYVPLVADISLYITEVSKAGLHLTLFLIGCTLSRETLKTIGLKPLIFSVIIWILVSVLSLEIILMIGKS